MPWNFSPHPAVPGRFVNPFATWLTGVLLVLTATLPLHTRAAQPPAAERSQDNTDRDRKAERRAERQRQLASQPLLDSVIPVAQLK
ncbi:MAG: hypothetical protein OSB47_11265, partial [Pirellulaceae bacterium]|nr:hypothetical protein [Pirellulaceae bacterium]